MKGKPAFSTENKLEIREDVAARKDNVLPLLVKAAEALSSLASTCSHQFGAGVTFQKEGKQSLFSELPQRLWPLDCYLVTLATSRHGH